jgi:hypothetical protein
MGDIRSLFFFFSHQGVYNILPSMCTTCNACPSIYGTLTVGCWMAWNLNMGDPVPIIMHIEVSINGVVV